MKNAAALAPLVFVSIAGLAACAGQSDRYPSFTIPDANEASAAIEPSPMDSSALPDPASSALPLPSNVDERVASLSAAGEEAQRSFARASGDAARLVEAARGSSTESEAWLRAQVALADLAAHRSATRLALADIDLLASSAELAAAEEQDARTIAAAQARLAGYVSEQSQVLAELYAVLGA